MTWKFNNNEPIYLQIVSIIKNNIIAGVYPPGGQLPPVRQLANQLSVNPNTVQRAMLELEDQNLVFSPSTTGRFIIEDEDLPNRLKKDLAKENGLAYLKTMSLMGLSNLEALQVIESLIKEDNNA